MMALTLTVILKKYKSEKSRMSIPAINSYYDQLILFAVFELRKYNSMLQCSKVRLKDEPDVNDAMANKLLC